MEPLKAAVRSANRAGETRLYPGSPLLMAWALRPRDRLIACELRPDDFAALKGALPRQAGAEVLKDDGYEAARRSAKRGERLLLVVDPPYERPDDPARAADLVAEALARNPGAVIALWAPIKDLDGYDLLIGRVEDASGGRALAHRRDPLPPTHRPHAAERIGDARGERPGGLAPAKPGDRRLRCGGLG